MPNKFFLCAVGAQAQAESAKASGKRLQKHDKRVYLCENIAYFYRRTEYLYINAEFHQKKPLCYRYVSDFFCNFALLKREKRIEKIKNE